MVCFIKLLCVRFMQLCLQNIAEMEYYMQVILFLLVYNDPKIRIVVHLE